LKIKILSKSGHGYFSFDRYFSAYENFKIAHDKVYVNVISGITKAIHISAARAWRDSSTEVG
jgi:hypothetical protein